MPRVTVMLRNQQLYVIGTDGWNPGEEIGAFGPLWADDMTLWTVMADEIIAYRHAYENEVQLAHHAGIKWLEKA